MKIGVYSCGAKIMRCLEKSLHRTLAFISLACLAYACSPRETSPIDYVDPLIGTGSHSHTCPGTTVPFGAVQLGPDSYRYDRNTICGFSHTHLSGTGRADSGDILFLPLSGEINLAGDSGIYEPLRFRHRDEVASPGYYSVFFRREGVKAEMTATAHVGWHRYSWMKGKPHDLIIDMHHEIAGESTHEVELFQTAPDEIRGMRKTSSWTPDQYVYFVAKFSRPIKGIRYIDAHREVPSAEDCTGTDRQVVLSFGNDGGQVIVRAGLSLVDYDGAVENLSREDSSLPFDFDEVRVQADETWNKLLSKVMVEGGTRARKRNFYTALYHAAMAPNITSDADHYYRRQDGRIARCPWDTFYSTLSPWDVFRAWVPLGSMIFPWQFHDIAYSCLDMYDAAGGTGCMIGYHSVPIIVDAFLKGLLPEIDSESVLEAMVDASSKVEKGDCMGESASVLLEHAYDDWCIARFAEAVGRKDLAEDYYRRACDYRNVYDAGTGFFRGQNADGTFAEPFDIHEAAAWRYRFSVPHDFAGMSCLLGGRDKLAEAVDECLAASCNGPGHHTAYIYDYVGQPWKTQEWTRRICAEMYSDEPDGLCGNENCWQMSAWYVMTAMGLYEVCPGSLQFVLTTPMFDKVTLGLPGSAVLTITANDPAHNPYIRKVTLNGREIDKAYVEWRDLVMGGELHFELGTEPDKTLWTSVEAAPYSLTADSRDLPSIH